MDGVVLLADEYISTKLGYASVSTAPNTTAGYVKKMSDSWFSSMRSTEPMMRGAANERRVVNALMTNNSFILCLNVA